MFLTMNALCQNCPNSSAPPNKTARALDMKYLNDISSWATRPNKFIIIQKKCFSKMPAYTKLTRRFHSTKHGRQSSR